MIELFPKWKQLINGMFQNGTYQTNNKTNNKTN
jgi:hypothetical protein